MSISNSPRTWCLTRGRCVCARAWSAEGVRLTRITRGACRTGRQRVPGPSRVQEAVFHCEEQAICSRQVRALPGQTHTRSWVAPGAADAMNPRRRQKRQETMANKKFQIMIGLAYAPSPELRHGSIASCSNHSSCTVPLTSAPTATAASSSSCSWCVPEEGCSLLAGSRSSCGVCLHAGRTARSGARWGRGAFLATSEHPARLLFAPRLASFFCSLRPGAAAPPLPPPPPPRAAGADWRLTRPRMLRG